MKRRDLLGAALFLPGCSAPPEMNGAPAEEAVSHPVLQALAAERARFLSRGDPAEVFAVFYYHVTTAILRQLRSGTLREPEVVLELLVEFHAAWERNRSPGQRELHWQGYFRRAEELRGREMIWSAAAHPLDRLHPRSLPALAVTAHIDYDLPVCLARVWQRHPEMRGARLDSFEASFRALDPIFYECTLRGFQDLAKCIPGAPGPRMLAWQSRAACRMIVAKRRQAWNRAMRMISH